RHRPPRAHSRPPGIRRPGRGLGRYGRQLPEAPRVTLRVEAVSMRRRRDDEKLDRELAELAALADGSLSGERRAAAEARVDGSTELAALLAEQERAVSLTRSVGATVDAPASLRARVDAGQPARRVAPRRPLVVIGALATVVAALVIGF